MLGFAKTEAGWDITWDPADFQGEILIKAGDPELGTHSSKTSPNEGSVDYFFHEGFTGDVKFEVSDEAGRSQQATFSFVEGSPVSVS